MFEIVDAIKEWIVHTVADYGYVAIFLLMLLESACIPIPSEVTMLFGGAMAASAFVGTGVEPLNFWLVVAAGTLGNLVGSWLAYWVGLKGGRPLAELALAAGFHDQSHLTRVYRELLGTTPGRQRRGG